MFEGFSPRTIDFIANLSLNNNKPWFEAHKSEFQQVFQFPMKALSQTVFKKVSDKHPDHHFTNKVSRIYKDARYLRATDGPYRTSLWFSIEKPRLGAAWTDTPVFWFDLSLDGWSYGMGYGGAKSETMAKLRAQIDKDPKQFEKLTAFLDKQHEFVLDGADYVRQKPAPSPQTAPWYNKKSFSLIHKQNLSQELFSANLADHIAKGMMSLMPLYDYLIELNPKT
ncbi:MAG: DUF2461 domain-containing protein [Candidatus Nomurabacteria bacterium]|jgi:uncharacterized protein (TIGR02453 family)|nr:DUF2461 domain-containing protein [Candidatus Nomurabacteria bacterium]